MSDTHMSDDRDVAARMADLPDDILFGQNGEDAEAAPEQRTEEAEANANEAAEAGADDENEGEGAEQPKEAGDDDPEFEIVDPSNPEAKQTLKLSELVQSHREYAALANERTAIIERANHEARQFVSQRVQETEQYTRQAYAQLQAALQIVKPPVAPNPRDFQYTEDYNTARYDFEQRMGAYQQATQLAQHLQGQASQAAAFQQEQREEAELGRLTKAWPEFSKADVREAFVKDATQHYGVSAEELDEVMVDHRQVLILKDALAFRKAQAAGGDMKAKVVAKAAAKVASQPAAQGKRTLSKEQAQHMNARKALKESGGKDIKAAARAFERFV